MSSRTAYILKALFLLLFAGIVFWTLVYFNGNTEEIFNSTNLLVFFTVNLQIAIIGVLLFLVARNIIKLVFDRRKGILGSGLRVKLVLAFVSFALVPTGILFFHASGLLSQTIDQWFSSQVERSIDSSLVIARSYLQEKKKNLLKLANSLSAELQAQQLKLTKKEAVAPLLDRVRAKNNLLEAALVNEKGERIISSFSSSYKSKELSLPPFNPSILTSVRKSGSQVVIEQEGEKKFVRAYLKVILFGDTYFLIATSLINPTLTTALNELDKAYREYGQHKVFKGQIKANTILIFGLITGLIVAGAVWFGFYLAKQLTEPVKELASATQEIAKGNYLVKLPVKHKDEMGFLTKCFNKMAADLYSSKAELQKRQALLTSVLESLPLGVITLNKEKEITAINKTALEITDFKEQKKAVGNQVSLIPKTLLAQALERLLKALSREKPVQEIEIALTEGSKEKKILCTCGEVTSANKEFICYLILLDDITAISKAQRIAAWAEVAKRVAHEIKNPLTPIQLSAQRLEKLTSQHTADKEKITQIVKTIVSNVNSIKHLADEFSNFARLPKTSFKLTNLSDLVGQIVTSYAETYDDIVFSYLSDANVPDVMIDPDQIQRMIVNLLDNSVFAVKKNNQEKRITVKVFFDYQRDLAVIEIADTGAGIPSNERQKVFEPYYTTKPNGSGLGLAIVNAIVAEHKGIIEVKENCPQGALFVIKLPKEKKEETQRKLKTG